MDFQLLKDIGYDPYANAGDYYYDPAAADDIINFFKKELKFTKDIWKGKPFIPYPAQEERLRCMFGWKRKSDGQRRYRVVFLYIPRKNGKSEEAAGIANYCLFCDNVNDAEIYIGARDREQALTLYNMAESMVKQNDSLDSECLCYATNKEIRASWDNSKIKAIPGDALGQHSLSPSVGIIDELHAHRTGDLLAAIRTGMGGRQEPLLIIITTADIDKPSVCNEELGYARAVRDGKIRNLRYLPIIYETEKDADWKDEKVWISANPNYPNTPNKDYMIEQVLLAEKSLRIELEFKRYNLNMITANIEGWIKMEYWRLGNKEFDESELEGQDCYLAFDLGSKIDLCAILLFFPESMKLVCRFYCPKAAVENDTTGHYYEWVEAKELLVSGKQRTDYRDIENDILDFKKRFNIKKIAFDPHNANILVARLTEEFASEIEDDEDFIQEFVQSFRNFTDPAKEFESLVLDEKLKHNSRILDWMAANVTIREGPSGDIMPQKPKRNSPLKIDGIPAAIMAIGLWMTDNKEGDEYHGEGVYNLEDYIDKE